MVLFTLLIDSFVDVITNSSSELFVGVGTKADVQEMVREAYPDYRCEYSEVKGIEDMSDEDLMMYVSYNFEYWSNTRQVTMKDIIPGFTYEEMYHEEVFGDSSYTCLWEENLLKNKKRVMDGIDPKRNMFFMFSLDDNPDWEMQEKLMNLMTRYHLG